MPRPNNIAVVYFRYTGPAGPPLYGYPYTYGTITTWWDIDNKTLYSESGLAGGGDEREFENVPNDTTNPVDQFWVPASGQPRANDFSPVPPGRYAVVFSDDSGGVEFREATRLRLEPLEIHNLPPDGSPGRVTATLVPVLTGLPLTARVYGTLNNGTRQEFTNHAYDASPINKYTYTFALPATGHYNLDIQIDDGQNGFTAPLDVTQDLNLVKVGKLTLKKEAQSGAPGSAYFEIITQKDTYELTYDISGSVDGGPFESFHNHNLDGPGLSRNVWSHTFENLNSRSAPYNYVIQVADGQANLLGTFTIEKEALTNYNCQLRFQGYSQTPPAIGQASGKLLVKLSGGTGMADLTLSQDGYSVHNDRYDVTPPNGATFAEVAFDLLPAGLYTLTGYLEDHPSCALPTGNDIITLNVLPPPLEIGDQLSFVPWVQPQLMNDAQVSTGPRPTLKLGVRLQTDQQNTEDLRTTTLGQIYGPADVLGISQRAVLSTTPVPDASGFSPLQLAAIELKDEDLPWRYSTRKAADGTPLPWLQLLVLEAGEYDALPLAGQAIPGIQLHANVPHPSVADDQQALWAHVQLNGSLTQTNTTSNEQPAASTIQAFVDQAAASPDLAYSRIFCPRRLKADTTYRAFLVPALEVSRLTGLGQDASGVALDQVADPASNSKFPVYFQWQFSTGAEEDFESLLGQLHHAGDTTSTASAPILSLTLPTASTTPYELPMPSLLVDEQAPALVNPPLAVASYLYQQLAPGQGLPGALTQPRPVITPPLYGRAYMVTPTLLPPTASATGTAVIAGSWKHTVNLDPRYRAIAALGVQVVQANQEEYVRRAWDQVQDILLANEKLRGLQYSLRTTTGLRAQHLPLDTTATGTTAGSGNLTTNSLAVNRSAAASNTIGAATSATATATAPAMADYGLHLTGLALSRVKLTASQAPAELAGLTAREALRRSSTPLAAFSPTFRRITKPFGNYLVGETGRPLRPTEPEPADPVTISDPTALRGTSLRQRDGLLTALSSGEVTAAANRAEQVRAYQFKDSRVDGLLARLSEPNAPALTPAGLSGPALLRFNAAFSSFRHINSNTVVGFIKPRHVQPALPLAPLKEAVVTGTQPGPLIKAKIKTVAPAMPVPVVYSPGHFEGSDYNASHFYVGDYNEPMVEDTEPTPPIVPIETAAQRSSQLPMVTGPAAATSTTGTSVDDALPVIQQARVFPVFKDPMGEPLRQLHPELFVPGLSDFPAGGVAELQVNQAFIEAYMVGLNHALGSELHWRGFPVELRGTFFQQFWDVSEHFNALLNAGESPTAEQEQVLLDIAPLDHWIGNPIGENSMADHGLTPAPPTPLRLTLRSELLRRYPTLVIGLQPAGGTGPSDDLTQMLAPRQRLAVGQDVVIVIFDKSLSQAKADGDYLLLLERPGQPTFGLDELPAGGDPSVDPLSWNDLTWDYLGTPHGDIITIPNAGPNQPHATAEPASVAYLTDSANLAYALFQEPVLAALPIGDLLP